MRKHSFNIHVIFLIFHFKMFTKVLSQLVRFPPWKRVSQKFFYHNSTMNQSMKNFVDLRSDTFTVPTQEMRKAMSEAVVGDDVYEEDPTVNRLEADAAQLLGKEAALFLASGTMSNFVSVLSHSERRGSEILIGDNSHIFLYEQGGCSTLGSVHISALPNYKDGTFSLETLREKIRPDNIHQPTSKLLCIENTHNVCGGVVIPENFIQAARVICNEAGLAMHLDGARIMNAAVALKIPVAELCQPFDSVNLCLSKGLGAPMGSILAGSKDFVKRARYWRKAVGGAWRQAGIVAAAGLISIHDIPHLLKDDHRRANYLYEGLKQILGSNEFIQLADEPPHTNIVNVYLNSNKIDVNEIIEKMTKISSESIILATAMSSSLLRFVTYHQITDEDIEKALKTLRVVFHEILSTTKR